jgi:ribonuclease R
LDENGKPIGIHKKEHIETNSLIEEFMLLANREVAKKIEKDSGGRQPFIYRVHDAPDPDKLAHLGIFLKAWGYDFETKGETTSKDIQKMLEKVAGSDIQNLIEASTLRSMAKAVYSVQNIGHFGLGFTHYTHFTSPIRRYPDLIVHRIMDKYFNKQHVSKSALAHYRRIAKEASEKELEAVDAERASIKYKQVEYMSEHVGETFEGRIVGVVEYGLFVEELETLAEGLVPVSTLGGDYYVYDREKFELKGEKKGKTYRLGDKVKIKVTETNIESRTITFKIED